MSVSHNNSETSKKIEVGISVFLAALFYIDI